MNLTYPQRKANKKLNVNFFFFFLSQIGLCQYEKLPSGVLGLLMESCKLKINTIMVST